MVDPVLYQLAVEQTRDYAVFILDLDGRVMSWNAGARLIKGYTAAEIVGRHFSLFYPPEAVQSDWPSYELKVAAEEGRFEDEGWRVRKDGSRFWAGVLITALRGPDGRLLGFSKFTRDLTDRRLHEEALLQSEERFRLLVDGVVDYAIFMIDRDGVVSSWNTGACRMKGYTREEIVGRHFSRFYPPEDVKAGKPWEMLDTARRTGRAENEGFRVRKNGDRFWARAVLTALYDAAGDLRGFAKVTQDLTERRALQDLQHAAQDVNEFIATLAHELRNPLAPIRTAMEVMRKLPRLDPALDKMHQMIDRQSAQLVHIVDDMVDIARVTRGSLTIAHEPVNMADVVRRAAETAAPAVEAGRHTLNVDMPAKPIIVAGDLHRLTQVLTNLLNNSARYTPEGGTIAIDLRAESGSAVLRVIDNGRGIEPEMLDSIFDMFVQRPRAAYRATGGLGIGLALARRIAELHGGSLQARSEGGGKGSEFILRVPLQDPTSCAPDRRRRRANPVAQPSTSSAGSPTAEAPAPSDVPAAPEAAANPDAAASGDTPASRDSAANPDAPARRDSDANPDVSANPDGAANPDAPASRDGGANPDVPANRDAAANPEGARSPDSAAPAHIPLAARRILVVDDNIDAAVTLGMLLRSLGHDVSVVHDGVSAIERTAQFQPDVVLLDIGMPGMDGYEVARRLESLKRQRRFKIIAVTGWGQDADRQRSREAGLDVHLVKPVDFNELARVIAERNGARLQ